MLRGARELVAHALDRIGVEKLGDVSADGLFSVEEVECLGACEYAPMMRLDHRYWYDLTPEKLDAILEERRRTEPAQPVRSTRRHSTKGTPRVG
jgi:NADH-quinone oxidoreductase subunit E